MRHAFGLQHGPLDRHSGRTSSHLRGKSGIFNIDESQTEPFQGDPHAPQAIVDSYHRFKKRILDLDDELGRFSSECRQLGRSYALILAARDLREGLENLSSKFYDNAARLSPQIMDPERPVNIGSVANVDSFPFWFEGIAEACDTFRGRLSEFREYTDESAKIKSLMAYFAKDLRYRASCLKDYKELDTEYMRYYIHDLADEMGDDLTNLISAFRVFNEYGMSAMQYEQRRDTDTLHNVSTVATFFSAVTATTLQISLSFDKDDNPLVPVVNTFWFCSLVLSIGAALNSLLAAAWKRTPYGSRGRRLPVWITIWIHASAPAFLTISIGSFSAGLAFFTYAIHQENHTRIVTLVTIALTSFGLVTVATWLGYEIWIAPLMLPNAPWRPFIQRTHEWKETAMKEFTRPALGDHRRSRTGSVSERSDGSTRTKASSFKIIPQGISSRVNKVVPRGLQEKFSRSRPSDPESQSARSPTATRGTDAPEETSRQLWVHGAKIVTTLKTVTKAFKQSSRRTTTLLDENYPPTRLTASTKGPPPLPLPTSFPDQPTLTLPLLSGELQDMEYSPNGEYLAATCYDKVSESSETVFYTVSSNYFTTTRYFHQRGASKQVSWSPEGSKVLVRLDHSIDFLNETGDAISTVRRPHLIESAIWLTSDILSVERSTVFRITLEGQVQAKYRFENLLLRDVAVTPNPNLLLVTGRVVFSNQEILPSNSRGEKQLILFDTVRQKCISRHPVLDDVRFVRLSRHASRTREAFDILVSHKKTPPPRLWTLRPHIGGSHRLMPAEIGLQTSLELTGHGHFIGERDQMVACVGKEGDIHVWNRESGELMHRIQAQAVSNGLRCFAWHPRFTSSITFASADEKQLKIWISDGATAKQYSSPLPEQTRVDEQDYFNGIGDEPPSMLGTSVTFDEPISSNE